MPTRNTVAQPINDSERSDLYRDLQAAFRQLEVLQRETRYLENCLEDLVNNYGNPEYAGPDLCFGCAAELPADGKCPACDMREARDD